MVGSYLNFSIQKVHQNSKKNGGFCEELLSENDFEAVLINFCSYEHIIVSSNASVAVQKRRLAQGHCWSYANSLNSQFYS